MPSPMILVIVFAVIGICLIISGGIIVGSIKKLTGDDTAKKNIENVGTFMNIVPGVLSCAIAGFFVYKTRQPGMGDNNVSPLIVTVLAIALGVCLIISGGIIVGSIKKLTGDDTAKKNIENVGTFMNLVPGVFVVAIAVALFVKSRSGTSMSPQGYLMGNSAPNAPMFTPSSP